MNSHCDQASAQHQCQYLVTVHTNEFLQTGGDPLWLEGLSAAPPKLQSLSKINSILCHQPWTLSEEHIGALLRGADSWSKSELVQAIVLMATFYSLSSFILGCGVVPEIDMVGGTLQEGSENPAPDLDFHEDDEELLQQTRQLIQRLTNQEISQDSDVSPDVFESCDSQESKSTRVFISLKPFFTLMKQQLGRPDHDPPRRKHPKKNSRSILYTKTWAGSWDRLNSNIRILTLNLHCIRFFDYRITIGRSMAALSCPNIYQKQENYWTTNSVPS